MKTFDASTSSDAQLVTRYAEGRDEDAFAELVRRHAQMVFATVRRVLQNQEDAEEAFQAAFFGLAKAIKSMREPAAIAGWLHRAAYSSAVEIQRANTRWNKKQEIQQRELASGVMNPSSRDDPSTSSEVADLEKVVDCELNKLPGDLRTALVLCELEGLTQRQVGKQLGIAPSTVNDRVLKGRRLLRERLSQRGATLAALSGVLAKATESSAALSERLIAETLTKAPLFAAGQSAAQLGVSSNVAIVANKLSAGFWTARMAAVAGVSLIVLLVSVTTTISLRSRPFEPLHYFRFESASGFLEDSVGSVSLSRQNISQLFLRDGGPSGFAVIPNNQFALTTSGPIAALTTSNSTPVDDAFTIELLVRLNDLYAPPPNTFRFPVLAAQATDCEDDTQFGWALGISMRQRGAAQPRELGLSVSDGTKNWPIRSGIALEEDRDYFVSAAFDIRGQARFYVKDLETGVVEERAVEHAVPRLRPDPFLMIVSPHDWGFVDGVIDEVRFSRGVVPIDDLLINAHSQG